MVLWQAGWRLPRVRSSEDSAVEGSMAVSQCWHSSCQNSDRTLARWRVEVSVAVM